MAIINVNGSVDLLHVTLDDLGCSSDLTTY